MNITRNQPVTIKVDSHNTKLCLPSCEFFAFESSWMANDCLYCNKYRQRLERMRYNPEHKTQYNYDKGERCRACLADFGEDK